VASPNPAAQGAHVPLISTYWLSSKKGQLAWLKPVVDKKTNSWRFEVHTGEPKDKAAVKNGAKIGRGTFRCILTDQPIEYTYLRQQALEGKLGRVLLSIVADVGRGRLYVEANSKHGELGNVDAAEWRPDEAVTTPCHDVDRLPMYGMPTWAAAITPRQLTAMVTLSDLVKEVRRDVFRDACEAGLSDSEADHYAIAVVTFLAMALDRCADFNNAICTWNSSNQKVMHLFGRQAIPMTWDFAEANTLGDSVGAWNTCKDYIADCIEVVGKSLTPAEMVPS
jgi:putative DNA methylase